MKNNQTLSKAAIKKKILAVLDATSGRPDPKPGKHGCGMLHRTALVLATSYKDKPRATALEFFNEGLDLIEANVIERFQYFPQVPLDFGKIKRHPHLIEFGRLQRYPYLESMTMQMFALPLIFSKIVGRIKMVLN